MRLMHKNSSSPRNAPWGTS